MISTPDISAHGLAFRSRRHCRFEAGLRLSTLHCLSRPHHYGHTSARRRQREISRSKRPGLHARDIVSWQRPLSSPPTILAMLLPRGGAMHQRWHAARFTATRTALDVGYIVAHDGGTGHDTDSITASKPPGFSRDRPARFRELISMMPSRAKSRRGHSLDFRQNIFADISYMRQLPSLEHKRV